jgi:rhamnogalacturonyl hydrolase YesR
MKSSAYKNLLLIFSIVLLANQNSSFAKSPLEIAQSVADKIIHESQFELEFVEQEPVLNMQVLDFSSVSDETELEVAFAQSSIQSNLDTTVLLGISTSSLTKIWLNGLEIYQKAQFSKVTIKEESYNRFNFTDRIKINLTKGENLVLVKFISARQNSKVYLRLITGEGDQSPEHNFNLMSPYRNLENNNWLYAGPFRVEGKQDAYRLLKTEFSPERGIDIYYRENNRIISWQPGPRNVISKLKIAEENTYQRDSYLEWHYATGAMMWSILRLSQMTEHNPYLKYVTDFCEFTLEHYDYFKWQYHSLDAFRGGNHRIFRRTMLDDAGAPSRPFVTLAESKNESIYLDLIDQMADYVLNEQVRLADGTFCRPEPEHNTVWADDLFMSVPFLLEMGKLTENKTYYDEAVYQIKKFYGYLFDKKMGLNYHGWYDERKEASTVFWGRANGWMIWATSEALQILPNDYESYDDILRLYISHITGLLKYQDTSGMWHQVLDHPESYEETSCTAMYCLAIARGVRNGWLEPELAVHAEKAWKALQNKINETGTVSGICRGTGIGKDLNFYFTRKTFDHDPRGLGAVITAGIEMEKLRKR